MYNFLTVRISSVPKLSSVFPDPGWLPAMLHVTPIMTESPHSPHSYIPVTSLSSQFSVLTSLALDPRDEREAGQDQDEQSLHLDQSRVGVHCFSH